MDIGKSHRLDEPSKAAVVPLCGGSRPQGSAHNRLLSYSNSDPLGGKGRLLPVGSFELEFQDIIGSICEVCR